MQNVEQVDDIFSSPNRSDHYHPRLSSNILRFLLIRVKIETVDRLNEDRLHLHQPGCRYREENEVICGRGRQESVKVNINKD